MPANVVHLGLGNFFRAHQAWYTAVAPDAGQWAVAAFTGRSAALADALNAQGGRYTLLVRGPERDEAAVLDTISTAYAGNDLRAWHAHLADPRTAVVTLTVTESAYLEADDARVQADADAWRHGGSVSTVPGRLVDGLSLRRLGGGGPIAVVSCDNVADNGTVTARMVLDFAALVEPALVPWIHDTVSFVTTMVDRITPRTTPADQRVAAGLTGFEDAAPVVTEPFSEWVLSGVFPAGRPQWEAGGARFVADVHPHEQRKLLLLNGGHSLLAYTGALRGHETVAEAVSDQACRGWLEQWWDEASRHVPLPRAEVSAYRESLLLRFSNGRIRHTLRQIAADGSRKIPIRVLPVLRGERAAGRMPAGAVRILAAWMAHLRGEGLPMDDAGAGPYRSRAGSPRGVLELLAPDLAGDEELVTALS